MKIAPLKLIAGTLLLALVGCSDGSTAAGVGSGSARASSAPKPLESSVSFAPKGPPTASVKASEPGIDFVAGQQILVTWKGAERAPSSLARSKEEARKIAQDALARVKKGEDFTAVLKELSDDPDAKEREGNVGTIRKNESGKLPVYDKMFDLEVGAVSEIHEAKTGFYILKRTQ